MATKSYKKPEEQAITCFHCEGHYLYIASCIFLDKGVYVAFVGGVVAVHVQ